MASVNHISLDVNERGLALNVFWSRLWRDGRGEEGRKEKTAFREKEKEAVNKALEPDG
jgi:hypothetical protein